MFEEVTKVAERLFQGGFIMKKYQIRSPKYIYSITVITFNQV